MPLHELNLAAAVAATSGNTAQPGSQTGPTVAAPHPMQQADPAPPFLGRTCASRASVPLELRLYCSVTPTLAPMRSTQIAGTSSPPGPAARRERVEQCYNKQGQSSWCLVCFAVNPQALGAATARLTGWRPHVHAAGPQPPTWGEDSADLAAVEDRGCEAGALGVIQAIHVWLQAVQAVQGGQHRKDTCGVEQVRLKERAGQRALG